VIHPRRETFGQFQVDERQFILQHSVADVWVVKANELGINEDTIHTRSHLGHILKPGDSVMG